MELLTERLRLRSFREEDAAALHALEAAPEVMRYRVSVASASVEQARGRIRATLAVEGTAARRRYTLAMATRADDRLIGRCLIHITDVENREGELAWAVERGHWGQGYAPEAAGRLLTFGFDVLGLHRIIAQCHPDNRASERVMQKLGMRREGLLRQRLWVRRTWWDVLLYAILEHEWPPPAPVPVGRGGMPRG
jgi:[ribosomal protein S5]-alanine N-acetyltransferase